MSEGAPWQVLESVPKSGDAPVFAEPWQARIFAVVSRLCLDGRFPWDDFKARLIAEIGRGGTDDPDDYYEHFLNACERLLTAGGMLTTGEIEALKMRLAAHPPHPTTARPGPVAIDPVRESAEQGDGAANR